MGPDDGHRENNLEIHALQQGNIPLAVFTWFLVFDFSLSVCRPFCQSRFVSLTLSILILIHVRTQSTISLYSIIEELIESKTERTASVIRCATY